MLLGPFFTNPFPDRAASSPVNSVPKQDSDEKRVILNMSFPSGHSVNDGINKDCYLRVSIDLTFPTVDSFATMVKAVCPGALMYKGIYIEHITKSGQILLMSYIRDFSGRVPSILIQY